MKKLESLNKSKFTVLNQKNLGTVKGGGATGANQRYTGAQTEYRPRPDGRSDIYIRSVYQTWTSDDIGDGYEYYYGTGTAYGGWSYVGTTQ